MPEFTVNVRNRIASVSDSTEIVCGNSDYTVVFDFDAEWDADTVKTARVVWRDTDSGTLCFAEMLFTGSRVTLPPVYRVSQIFLGVYAGDIRSTAPVRIPCCDAGPAPQHPAPAQDVYTQLLRYLKQLRTEQTCSGSAEPLCCGSAGLAGKPIREEAI